MATYSLPYGYKKADLHLNANAPVDWIEPAFQPAAEDPIEVVRQALEKPVDGLPLDRRLAGKHVAIAINDKTRPVPHDKLLPPLLDALHAAGVQPSDITFYIAVGTHIPMPPEEFPRILPQAIREAYRVISHDCDDPQGLVDLGRTRRGTPVQANRGFYESDFKIVVGNIEPHHFAGFSGGYKTAAIGLAGRETINTNHTMLVEPGARIASITENPLRQDIDEIGAAMGVHFALNAVLNGDKEIVQVVAGTPEGVMQAGVPLSQAICQIPVHGGRYDMVVASAGGAPKDINFYQSQKALSHAALFTRNGGVMILAAACPEGAGSASYEEFMVGVNTPEEVFTKFRALGFRVGPHKAFQVAREAARVRIILVSEIPPEKVARLLMTPASNLDEAYQIASGWLNPSNEGVLRTAILPRATNTIPVT